jgi:hypothetical protein
MRNGGDWLIDHLRILQLLNEARYFIKGRIMQMNQNTLAWDSRTKLVQPQREVGLDIMVYLNPWISCGRRLRVTEGLIVQMRNEVREKGLILSLSL